VVRILLPLALLLIAFWVYSIVDCALQPPTRHRGVSKPLWIVIVVLLPVIGGLMWFVVGRGRARPSASARPTTTPTSSGACATSRSPIRTSASAASRRSSPPSTPRARSRPRPAARR
jgi:hypothetical protein